MLKQILVPLDGSELAEHAIPMAARLARASGGTVTLVRIVRGPTEIEMSLVAPATWAPAADPKERDYAAGYLARIAERKELAQVPTTVGVYAGPAAPTLLAVARALHTDTIVMTSRGRTGLARMLLGSVARDVARGAGIPVLIWKSAATEAALPQPEAGRPVRALVTLDGSRLAEAALAPAAHVVAALSAPAPGALHLFQVVELVSTTGAMPLAPSAAEGRVLVGGVSAERFNEATEYLSATAARLRQDERAGLNVTLTWSVARSLDVASAITHAAETGEPAAGAEGAEGGPCDLIALATHGRGGVRRWAVGSIAEQVLQSSQLPVLIVRPAEIQAAAPAPGAATEPRQR